MLTLLHKKSNKFLFVLVDCLEPGIGSLHLEGRGVVEIVSHARKC